MTQLRILTAKMVYFTHIASILFLVFGCLLPLGWLKIHLIALPVVMVQWWVNSDRCVLTQLQYWLEGETVQKGEEGAFIKVLFGRVGINPTRGQTLALVYGSFFVSGFVSAFRLWG